MTDEEEWSVHADFWQARVHWRVARVTLDERMSAPMVATLRIVGEGDAERVALGRAASLHLQQGELERTFSGIVTRVEPLGRRSGLVHARVVLESRVALARTTRRWRIFQDVTAETIAQWVLGAMPGVTVESRLQRAYTPVEYRVQYGQDDLGFVCRVLEDAGISWVTEPSVEGETVILLDAAAAFVAITPEVALAVVERGDDRARGERGVQVQLGADAVIEGAEVRSTSANGSLALNRGGAKLDGATVDVTAMTMATVLAAMVKIN